MLSMDELLKLVLQKNASDLHLTVNAPPMLRIDGEIHPTHFEKLTPDICQRLIYSLLTDRQKEKFEAIKLDYINKLKSRSEIDIDKGVWHGLEREFADAKKN